jgi:hypothetical protein
MKLFIILILTAFLAASCGGGYRCYPSKGSKDYAQVINVQRTLQGWKYVAIRNDGKYDTFPCHVYHPVGSCVPTL